MKSLAAFLGVVIWAFATHAGEPPPAPAVNSPQFPAYVLQKIDDQYRGNKSHGILEMKIKTKHWTRALSLESWSLGKDHSLIKILKPKKERGTATLKADKTLFTYLNKTGRTIKINSSMMGSSWMGSHFTNDDLVQETKLSRDFHITFSFNGQENGISVYKFDLVPKPDVPVVYGKIRVTVRADDLQPLQQLFFDEDGVQVRLLEYSDHTVLDGRTMPRTIKVTPLDGSGEYTIVTWKRIDFNVNIKKSFFSIHNLKSI